MHLIFDALHRQAAERPEAVAFREADRSLTWRALAEAVTGAAAGFAAGPHTVALRFRGLDYVIADLAATLAGRRIVPVPEFFSDSQIAHLLQDAGTTDVSVLPEGGSHGRYAGGAERVIYTSGTTGRPKGVILGDRQLTASITGLAAAISPQESDRYASVLPSAQLLEQICGIFLPILGGAVTTILPAGVATLFGGPVEPFVEGMAAIRPTTTVLAPRQLALWVAALRASGQRAPEGLRYVAVGGAPVAPALLAEARALGIPAHQGYGLSEACSVVALSRIGDDRPGSVGQPLDGLRLRIEEGEIVVAGPTVMQGYLNQPPLTGDWHTGDLGRIEGGLLFVEGRRDAMIVTSAGRNIAPEWVEAEALADPAVIAAALVQVEEALVLLLAPARAPDLAALAERLAALPGYARPSHLLIADPRSPGLIRPSGTADRRLAATLAADRSGWVPLTPPLPERKSA